MKTITKYYVSTFIRRKAMDEFPTDLFPEWYNSGLFKTRVDRHYIGVQVPSISLSLSFRSDGLYFQWCTFCSSCRSQNQS